MPTHSSLITLVGAVLRRTRPADSHCEAIRALGVDSCEVELQKGANVLLYRCGESGGAAYLNLHFDDATHNAVTIYPQDATDKQSFFDEIQPLVVSVEPTGKLTTTWADIKRQ